MDDAIAARWTPYLFASRDGEYWLTQLFANCVLFAEPTLLANRVVNFVDALFVNGLVPPPPRRWMTLVMGAHLVGGEAHSSIRVVNKVDALFVDGLLPGNYKPCLAMEYLGWWGGTRPPTLATLAKPGVVISRLGPHAKKCYLFSS